MNQQQLECLEVMQEVLRVLTVTLGALNPGAMPVVAAALRAGARDGRSSPLASQMLDNLADGIELFVGAPKPPAQH